MSKETNVLESVYEPGRLLLAWQQVKQNAGAAGIDNMSVNDFENRKGELFPIIYKKLKEVTYKFKPARRVEIPKEGSSKPRKLGIPVVMDRIVSQSINLVFDEIFSKDFTDSNYGFRKGKSQHQAINHVLNKVKEGYEWCASVDLKSFFDEIPHNLILCLIRRKIADENLVTLVARAIKAGVIIDGKKEKTTKGCPQGSPLSPMLSNIVLNEMDYELEKRSLSYCRWADDFVILLKSERAAKRVMEGITRYLEENLKLPVNREKSQVAKIRKITFLGFEIVNRSIRVSKKVLLRFKEKIKALTRRNNPLSMYQIIYELNKYLRGWVSYFKVQGSKYIFKKLDTWIRVRIRSTQLKKWKKPKKFQRIMIKAGYPVKEALQTYVKMDRWYAASKRIVCFVLNIEWFKKMNLIFLHDFTKVTS